MSISFQADRFHFNNRTLALPFGDLFSGFSLEDQSEALCLVFHEDVLSEEQIEYLKRVQIILAQKPHENVLTPLGWGRTEIDGGLPRSYVVYPGGGRPLSHFENLKALPPTELLIIMRGLLRALCFAESKEVHSHGFIHPLSIRIRLESSEVRLGLFGLPLAELRGNPALEATGAELFSCFPPAAIADSLDSQQRDLYALGLISLGLATGRPHRELLGEADLLLPERIRQLLGGAGQLPLPIQELLYKLITPVLEQRYSSFKQALDDVQHLCGEDQLGLRFTTFILDTLINGRFKLEKEINAGRVSRIYSAIDTRGTDEGGDDRPCVVKLLDLRAHPGMGEAFHTRFKTLTGVRHDHIMAVYDAGVHFENGYLAMESGLQSLEDLLIKRGTLPLPDAGRIIFQLCKALDGLHFHHINYHGGIKPSNVFLTTDLKTVKLADALISDFFLRQGNLNNIGAEYFNPEFIKDAPCDQRSDLYNIGLLFFEMLAGHPPFCFKVEEEIIADHLTQNAATRVEPALMANEVKDIILRLLEKNPAVRYQTVKDLMDELTVLLGYDKKEQVEVPNLLFDFAELSMVGKNTREKGEETLAVRLPAVNNRARGAIALLIGHGRDHGDSSKAAQSALTALREMLFHPAVAGAEVPKLQKTDPEAYLDVVLDRLNQRLYREAFAQGKLKHYGVSATVCMIQENTLYMHSAGVGEQTLFALGSILDHEEDKWTIRDEVVLGSEQSALSAEVAEQLGFGERVRVLRLKRRLQDGDQLLLASPSLTRSLSISELKELATSSSEPAQAVDMVRSDAIRRRLEGTISCVLLNIGNVAVFAEENISHAKKGMLARNFLAQGDSFLQDNKIDEAIEQYTQAIEINPRFAIIHHRMGLAYVRKGLLSYGISCFERAIELNSKLASSYTEIAGIMHRQRRSREVLPLLRRAVAEGCKDAELYAMLGHELLGVRNYDEAAYYSALALELDPGHPTAYRQKMLALRRRNSIDTKLIKALGSRQRLADDKTRISQEFKVPDEEA